MQYEKIAYGGETYYLNSRGYFWRPLKISGSVYLHNRVYVDQYGAIPKGHHVHHKDGDKRNNDISNLECLSPFEHKSAHIKLNHNKNLMQMTVSNIKDALAKIADINDDALFEPNKIVKMNLVVNTKLVPSVFTLYRLIKSGKLKAVTLGTGDAPRYFVKGKDLKKFLSNCYQLET